MLPIVATIAMYERTIEMHLFELGLIALMAMHHRLSGKKNPIFTNWLMPGGSNPNSSYYSVEEIEKTTYECCAVAKKDEDKIEPKRTLFIWIFVHLKALTMMCVVIAILAVDFPPIFSRSLCKSEELGISLMDTGVALITLNAGMSG